MLTLIRCKFHTLVTATARKRPRSFCQKCRCQVTPTHAYTLDPSKSAWDDYAVVQAEFGNLSGNELTRNLSGNTRLQSSQLAELLWTDPGRKNGISLRELTSSLKKKRKAQAGSKISNILPKILALEEKVSTRLSPTWPEWEQVSWQSDGVVIRRSRLPVDFRQERRVNFLAQKQLSVRILIWCLFHPHVTAVTPRSLCQQCRRQVTDKHVYTIDLSPPDSPGHLDKRSKRYPVSSNSWFDGHSPKAHYLCFRKQPGHASRLLSEEVC